MTYKERQKDVQRSYFLEKDKKMGGEYKGKGYDYILKDSKDNFREHLYKDVVDYFAKNSINWWGGKLPTGNTLSSQIACINHLFPIRQDHDAVLAIAQSVDSDFDDVEKLPNDKDEKGYISFEVVSATDHLNEARGKNKKLHRGSQCTSIDAIIIAKKHGTRVLLVIEWKYVEFYGNEDKSKNVDGNMRGNTRLNRYSELIQQSEQLKNVDNCRGSVYFFEPFYQLMRQTLWAEQMVNYRDEEDIRADDYIHVHVVPLENEALLQKKYKCGNKCGGKDMLATWTDQLENPDKYKRISPEELLSKLTDKRWEGLIAYLKERYWQ